MASAYDSYIKYQQEDVQHCRSILVSRITNATCKCMAIEPPYVERDDLKESLKKDGLNMKEYVDGRYYPILLICGPHGAGKSAVVSEILKHKMPVVHVTLSKGEKDIVEELVTKIIIYHMGISRVLPPGIKGEGLLESVFNKLRRSERVPMLLIEVNAQYSSSALQDLFVKLKTWGDDERYIRSVVVLPSTRAALTMNIDLDELRVRCLNVPDLNTEEVKNFVKQMLSKFEADNKVIEEVIDQLVPIVDVRLNILQDLNSKVRECKSLEEARTTVFKEAALRKERYIMSARIFMAEIEKKAGRNSTKDIFRAFKKLLDDDLKLTEFCSMVKLTKDSVLDTIFEVHPHPFYVCPITQKMSIASPLMKHALTELLQQHGQI